MIAFPNDLPLVRLEDGDCLAFERDWLVRSLICAARKAGYPNWWLADHVAQSVTEYLRSENDVPVVQAGRLEQAVQSVLQVIGFGDVGSHFAVGRPVIQISLVDLARDAGTGYELAFFELLRARLDAALASHAPHFELRGLEPCVKVLRARKVWSRDCDGLRAEIVSFTREQMGIAAARHDITFSLT